MSVRYLTEGDVGAILSMRDALALVEEAARRQAEGTAMNRPRQRVTTEGTTLHVLPASVPGYLGHKSYTTSRRGGRYFFSLYSDSGELLAIIEAERLGQMRTGAASGIAARTLARADSRRMGVIGTGYQAQTQIEAICSVLPIEHVSVFGRDRMRRETFAREVGAQMELPVEAAGSARSAIDGADVVVTMTNSADPVLLGNWLGPGVTVIAAGSNKPASREIDAEVVRRASRVVVEDLVQAKAESGDLRFASEEGAFDWQDAVLLSDVIAGKALGRTADAQIVLFESLGIGLWDVASAKYVYETAIERNLGLSLPVEG